MEVNPYSLNYYFNAGVAQKVGSDGAVILNNFHFWITKNMANNKHYHEGKYWTYNSQEAFTKLFPYLTKKQIRRILDNLKKEGYIETGNFNKVSYDRTTWYTLTEKGWQLICPNGQMSNTNMCPNGQMEMTKWANGNDQMGQPIPYNKPDNKTNNNKCSPKVDELWKLYPRKQGKTIAYKKIPKLIEEYGFEQIERCIKRYVSDIEKMRIEKKYILIGSTFFNGRFEDYLDENYEDLKEENKKDERPKYDKNGFEIEY